MKKLPFLFSLLTLIFAFGSGCESKPSNPNDPVARGKAVYNTACVACHNSDPRKPGPVGPEIWGSSKELLSIRVLEAKYPPGYTPKRTTTAMAPLPQYKNDIDALHAFLNSPQD